MKELALIYPYYNNPQMLGEHYNLWRTFDDDTKGRVEFIVVDDGSQKSSAGDVPRPDPSTDIKIYRILEDKDWNWCGARNLGAFVAESKWLLLTDMDHMVPEATLKSVLKRMRDDHAFMFSRVDAPDMRQTLHNKTGCHKPHPNSWAMSHKAYWRVGGYDEFYAGHYGFDGVYHSRVAQHLQIKLLADHIIRVPREVVSDASTDNRARKESRAKNFRATLRTAKAKSDHADKILTLQFKWVREV